MPILFNCPPSTASYHPLASPPHLTLLLYSDVRLMMVEKLLSAAFIDTFIPQQSSFDPALPLVTWELILASLGFLPGSIIMGIYITGLQSKGEEKGMFMCGLWRDLIKQWSSFQNTRLSRKKQLWLISRLCWFKYTKMSIDCCPSHYCGDFFAISCSIWAHLNKLSFFSICLWRSWMYGLYSGHRGSPATWT